MTVEKLARAAALGVCVICTGVVAAWFSVVLPQSFHAEVSVPWRVVRLSQATAASGGLLCWTACAVVLRRLPQGVVAGVGVVLLLAGMFGSALCGAAGVP